MLQAQSAINNYFVRTYIVSMLCVQSDPFETLFEGTNNESIWIFLSNAKEIDWLIDVKFVKQ